MLSTMAIIISSCKKEKDPEIPPVVVNPKVYVVGYLGTKACLWVDGKLSILSEPGLYSRAYDIKISGDDTFICGFESKYAVYWKNGVRVRLSDSTSNCTAEKIFISGTNMYIIGYQDIDYFTSIPKFWVNGADVPLSTIEDCRFTDVYVSGNDVYILGYEKTVSDRYRPIVWKNGIAEYFTDGTVSTILNSVFVKGNDIYIAGYEIGSYDHGIACYWKNSDKIYLPCDGFDSHTRSIFMNGDTLYIGGNYRDNITADVIPVYWKNGVIQPIGHSDDFDCLYNSFFIYNNDVYATGQQYNQGNKHKASYSKNGEYYSLCDTTISVSGQGIFVK